MIEKKINPKKPLKKEQIHGTKSRVKKTTKESQSGRNKFSKSRADKVLKAGIKIVKKKDIEKVYKERDKVIKKAKTEGPLKEFFEDIKLLVDIIIDYWYGRYIGIPYYFIAAIIAALLYVLAPIDLIPDFIPGIGYIDDAAVVAACLRLVHTELQEYKKWKNRRKK